jgi:hypothetical protein
MPAGRWCTGELLIFSQQAEWRSRHKGFDIAGKLTVCTASPSGLGRRGHKTSRASCVRQHAPTVSAKKGTRHLGRAASQAPAVSATERRKHRGQASLMVTVVQKGVDGTAHDHAENCLNRRIFFAGKATAHASTSMQRLTRSPAFFQAKTHRARGRVRSFPWSTTKDECMEHHLR